MLIYFDFFVGEKFAKIYKNRLRTVFHLWDTPLGLTALVDALHLYGPTH